MYIGLNLTFASSFQMFRGAVIIFVALLSVAFLQRRLVAREWTGIFIIVVGLAMVGAADMLITDIDSKYSRNNIITGDLLILLAQIITAVQMVYEEKFVAGMDIPALQGIYAKSFIFALKINSNKVSWHHLYGLWHSPIILSLSYFSRWI